MPLPCSPPRLSNPDHETDMQPVVIKVGGSLFDLPNLRQRLHRVLTGWASHKVLLIAGGGPFAEAVRQLDRMHQFHPDRAHWLALHATRVSSRFLADLLDLPIAHNLAHVFEVWKTRPAAVLDLLGFAGEDEHRPGHLPHSWDATTDSFAARVAHLLNAERLVLLKSTNLPTGRDWHHAAQAGLVDACFPDQVGPLVVQWVNLRENEQ